MARELVFAASPLPAFGGHVIVAPFQFATDGEDNLRVVSSNSLAGVRIQIAGRRFDTAGRMVSFSYDHVPAADRSIVTSNHPLGAGALVNLHVIAMGVTPIVGQTYVIVQLIRGLSGAMIVVGSLIAGYVTATQGLGWPGSPIESSISGGGYVRSLTGTAPALGTEITETVPTGARWHLLTVKLELDTSGVAAARRPLLLQNGAANYVASSVSPVDIQANSFAVVTFAPGLIGTFTLSPPYQDSALPDQSILLAGQSFASSTANLQGGDQYVAPNYQVREWLEVT